MDLGLLNITWIPLLQKATTGIRKYCQKKLLSKRCSSPISITVVNEKYNNINEKKYNAHV